MGKNRPEKAVVFAYHEVGVRCLRVLLDFGVEVPLVVTHRDDPGETIFFGSVAALARSRGIETLEDPDEDEIAERLARLQPEFIFSFYYRRMLALPVLRMASRGAFNMHGSLLPKYRGRAPVNWAVLKGETETGATLHEMVEKPDAGRLVGQARVAIGPEETAAEVFAKVTSAAESVLKECLGPLLDGSMKLKEQDLRLGSYFGGRKPEDGRIDWSKSAQEIHNLVRAVAPPYPGAFTDFEGRRLKILRSRVEKGTNPPGGTNPAGQKGPYRRGEEWFAACGDGKVLRLLDVELENK